MYKREINRIIKQVKNTHWTKSVYHSVSYKKDLYCLVGFINKEFGSPPFDTSRENDSFNKKRETALRGVMAAIKLYQPGTRATDIESWNDRRATTKEDIIAVLEKVKDLNERDYR